MSKIYKWGERYHGARVWPLHAGQRQLYTSTARYKIGVAGAQSGKTAMGPLWMWQQIDRVRQIRDTSQFPWVGMLISPTYNLQNRTALRTLLDMFKGAAGYTGIWNSTRRVLQLPDGEIYCLSAEHPDRIEGSAVDFIHLDEAGQMPVSIWYNAQSRMITTAGEILITTTPYRRYRWLKNICLDAAQNGDPDYCYVNWPSSYNPVVSTEEWDRLKRTTPPEEFNRKYLGQWTSPEGQVYPDYEKCIVDELPDLQGMLYGGMDFGFTEPTAALVACEMDGILYVFQELYKSKLTVSQLSAKLPSNVLWWADPSQPGMIQELNAAGHSVRKANNQIRIGIDAVLRRIYNKQIRIHRNCRALIAEMAEYRYPQDLDNGPSDVPIKEFDHACDALRYLVAGLDRARIADG